MAQESKKRNDDRYLRQFGHFHSKFLLKNCRVSQRRLRSAVDAVRVAVPSLDAKAVRSAHHPHLLAIDFDGWLERTAKHCAGLVAPVRRLVTSL